MCGDCFVCIYLVCQCDGLELGRRNRRITVRGVAVRINNGDFNEHIIANLNILLDVAPGDCGSYTEISSVFTTNLHQSSPQEPDWYALRPFFAWTSPSSIKDTFNVTTRHGTAPHTQDYIKKHFKSRNPVFNIPRRSEAVATDTIFSDTPAVDDGSTMAKFFCGCDTLVCDAYGIKSIKQFINTLSDNI